MATALAPPEAFVYTATGTLGEKRDTMLENQLLLRCQLSQPMKRGYTKYPGKTFRYGKPNTSKDGSASDVWTAGREYYGGTLLTRLQNTDLTLHPAVCASLSSHSGQDGSQHHALSGWPHSSSYFHKKSAGRGGDLLPERDFMALNRSAVLAGLTTAREQSEFRTSNDIRKKVPSESGQKQTTKRIEPTAVFGIATRPSTPIHDLLEHKYQDRWVAERRTIDLSKRRKDNSNKLVPGKVYETRASMLRSHQLPVQSAPLWQLPKFTHKASPQLETFRSELARDRALSHHKSDAIGRQGVFGHGIHEPATH